MSILVLIISWSCLTICLTTLPVSAASYCRALQHQLVQPAARVTLKVHVHTTRVVLLRGATPIHSNFDRGFTASCSNCIHNSAAVALSTVVVTAVAATDDQQQ
eukprot:17670-Heterococcus_DN1.PRE.2